MNYEELYRVLDANLRTILTSILDRIPADDAALIVEFVDVCEYGLALETICDVLRVDRIPVSEQCYAIIAATGDMMELDPGDNWVGVPIEKE